MKIIITGSTGFLGKHLTERLTQLNYYVYCPTYLDLTTHLGVDVLVSGVKSDDIVIHCAAKVGGIRYNLDKSADIYYDNVIINTLLIDGLAKTRLKKLIFISSVCAYPHNTQLPTRESELFTGPIEPSNNTYGTSKLIALTQLRACQQQYGLNFSYPLLANLYGPGDRGFINPNKAHLIPNLIRQFCEQSDKIEMFGDGKLTRDLLYVEDAVEAIVKMIDVDYSKPVNISTNTEISIRELVDIIVNVTDYQGEIVWPDSPDKGELRRCYDNSLAKKVLGWKPQVYIKEGLERTVEWYKSL